MTTRNRPQYSIFSFDLTNGAGQGGVGFPAFDLPIIGTRITFVGAFTTGTTAPVNALVQCEIGKALGDPIPMTPGSKVRVDNKYDFVRLMWTAQAGITATFLFSDDVDGNGIEIDPPPIVTVGNVAISQGGNTALVTNRGDLQVVVEDPGGNSGMAVIGGAIFAMACGFNGSAAVPLSNPASNSLPLDSTGAFIQPGQIGGSFYNAVPGANATTIVAAGSNVHGVVVRTAEIYTGSAGDTSLCAGTSAPTTATSNPAILRSVAAGGLAILPREIFLPAGQGLYVWQAGGTSPLVQATYDIR